MFLLVSTSVVFVLISVAVKLLTRSDRDVIDSLSSLYLPALCVTGSRAAEQINGL